MKDNFRKKKLKNGMTVLFEKRDIPVVSLSISVRCGGINEDMDEKGISHFIEHMLYKGTSKRDAYMIAQEIEKKGGELNGFTAEDITSFWCKMPSRHLDTALEVLSDIMKNPKFDSEEIEKERRVIFEELKMRKDSPRHYVVDKIQSMLYTGTLGADLIGTEETMNSIKRKHLVKRFKEVYSAENMILTVVGNCEFEKIVDWAEKNFKKKKGKIKKIKFRKRNGVLVEEREGIDQANMILAFHSPLASSKKVYAAEILATLMGGGMSSRLFSEIREKRNLVYSIQSDLDTNKEYSHTIVYAGCNGDKIEEVRKLILKEFDKVSKTLTEKELNSIKDQLVGNFEISMEDSQRQMIHLLVSEIDSKAEDFYDYAKNVMDVKLKDVKELASKVKEGKYSFFALVPAEK